jgi:hypothetical protein
MNAREIFLFLMGSAITLLVFVTVSSSYARDYRRAVLSLVSASALALVFFRKRKIALATIRSSWVLMNVGLTFPFHPTFLGIVLIIGSAAAVYLSLSGPSDDIRTWPINTGATFLKERQLWLPRM